MSERLEEIMNRYEGKRTIDVFQGVEYVEVIRDDLNWLIQQNHILNQRNKRISDSAIELQSENKRYRELITTFSGTEQIAKRIYKEQPDITFINPQKLIKWVVKESERLVEESK